MMILAVLCLFSCREESTSEMTDTIPIGLDTNYQQLVYGQVLTTSGDPISNVLVTVKDQNYITDDYGRFKFDEVYAGNKGTQISATKEGFLYGGYRLYAGETGNSHVEIVLMDAKDLGDIPASVGGTINVTDKSSVTFPSDAFTLNGVSYSGNVNVLGNWIDPTADEMLRVIPGDLTGIDIESQRVVLTSFGMIGIELRTDSGEELQIADDKMVELIYEVPDAILGDAPATIPLWSFDEQNGLWIEEESATLVGNQYVGLVSHFTWWNTDIPNSIVEFCITIINEETGQPMANQEIKINNLSGYGCAWGITNERGIICGVLPENSQFEVIVLLSDSNCPEGNPVYNIGPYTIDDAIVNEVITVNYGNDVISNFISGTITDCITGNPVTDATVLFDAANISVVSYTDDNGYYNQEIITCSNISTLEITAVDFVSQVTGEATLNNLSGGTYVADIALCDDFVDAEWLLNTASGFVMVTDVVCKVKPFETIITSSTGAADLLGFDCTTVGTCDARYVGTFGTISDLEVEISDFGNVGQAVRGSFSGINEQGETVWGSFNAERVE